MSDEKETDVAPDSPDVHFEPVVRLAPVEMKTLEEEEDVLFKMRAKLYRYDTASDPREWKERGLGECRILKHKTSGQIRFLMRRDKTLKICANHYIYPEMTLKPNCGSDRAWVWTTLSDFADEESKEEVLAIKFANAEIAQNFKTVFEESAEEMGKIARTKESAAVTNGDAEKNGKAEADDSKGEDERPEADQLSGKMKELKVEDAKEDKKDKEGESESKSPTKQEEKSQD